jgi:hypothetical protein
MSTSIRLLDFNGWIETTTRDEPKGQHHPIGNDLTKAPLRNIAASARQRLLNKSRSDIRPYQKLV